MTWKRLDLETESKAKRNAIDLVRVMAATDEDRLILMFSQTGGCEEVFLNSAEACSSPTH